MKKTTSRQATSARRSTAPTVHATSPFSPAALRAFSSLDPHQQVSILSFIARLARPRLKPSALYTNDAQRQAAREWRAHVKAATARHAAEVRERNGLREQLEAIHPNRDGIYSPAKLRRREALYARLNALDGKGVAR